jgi:hypothetical protein
VTRDCGVGSCLGRSAPESVLSAMVWARVMEMVDMRSTMRMKSLRLLCVE